MARTIRRLMLRNFRLVEALDLILDRVNLFVGPTGAGKSSVRLAAEFGILRRNEMTDGRGTGITSQVRHGAKAGNIVLELDNGVRIECEFPKEQQAAAKSASALRSLGLDELTAPAILRGEAFLDRPDADRRSTLQAALGIDLRQERMIGMLNTWDERFPDLGEWLDAATAQLQWNGRDYEKLAREQRTIAGRFKDEAEKQLAGVRSQVLDADGNTAEPARIPFEDLADAQRRRDALLQALGAIDAAEAPAREAHAAAVKAWEEAVARRHELEAEYERVTREADAAKEAIEPQPAWYRPTEELQAELEALSAQLESARGELHQVRARRAGLLEERRQVQARGENGKSLCPTCQRPYDPAADTELGRIESEDGALRKRQDEIEVQGEALRQRQQEASQASLRASQFEARDKAAREALARLQPRLLDLHAKLRGKKPATRPPALPASSSRRDERDHLLHHLAEVDGELARLHEVRATREQWDRDFLALEQLMVQAESRTAEWARWDACVKALEPRGLAARISAEAVGAWASEVDAEARKWFGLGFHLEMTEKTWDLYGGRRDGWVPERQLSGGERLLLSAVIQVSLARRTGCHVVFLDEVQRADATLRVRLVRYLLASGVQAFLFAAAQDRDDQGAWVRPTAPPVDGLSVLWVEDGRFEIITPAAVAA